MVNMGEIGNGRMIPRPAIGVYQKISIQIIEDEN